MFFFSVKLTASAIVEIIPRTDTSALCHSFFQGWNPPPPRPRFSEGTAPFLVIPIFLKQILKITPLFLRVHANCMKNFKMKELHFVLY